MAEITIPCQWFALCTRDAVGVTPHPVLGAVPICQPCADKFDLPVEPATFVRDES